MKEWSLLTAWPLLPTIYILQQYSASHVTLVSTHLVVCSDHSACLTLESTPEGCPSHLPACVCTNLCVCGHPRVWGCNPYCCHSKLLHWSRGDGMALWCWCRYPSDLYWGLGHSLARIQWRLSSASKGTPHRKIAFSFGDCPNYLPPNLPPIPASCTTFMDVKNNVLARAVEPDFKKSNEKPDTKVGYRRLYPFHSKGYCWCFIWMTHALVVNLRCVWPLSDFSFRSYEHLKNNIFSVAFCYWQPFDTLIRGEKNRPIQQIVWL